VALSLFGVLGVGLLTGGDELPVQDLDSTLDVVVDYPVERAFERLLGPGVVDPLGKTELGTDLFSDRALCARVLPDLPDVDIVGPELVSERDQRAQTDCSRFRSSGWTTL
jgi:hypothetical protein